MSVDILNQILNSLPPDNAGTVEKTASAGEDEAIIQLFTDVLGGDDEPVKEAASCETNEKMKGKHYPKEKMDPDEGDEEDEPQKEASADAPFEISEEALEAAIKTAQQIHRKAFDLQKRASEPEKDASEIQADAREILSAQDMLAKIAMSEVAHAEFLATVTAAAMADELVKIGTHLGQGGDYESMEKMAFLGRLMGRGAARAAEDGVTSQAAMELAQAMKRRQLLAALGAGAVGGGAVGTAGALIGGGDEGGDDGYYNPYGM